MNEIVRAVRVGIFGAVYAVSSAGAEAAPIAPASESRSAPLQIADLSGIEEWRAGGPTVVYIRDDNGQWYRIDMHETCMKLDTSKGLRFLTEVGEHSSRYSEVEVAHHQCRVTAITKVEGPPSK